MERWEGQVRQAMRSPVGPVPDRAAMVDRVQRGARARVRRRALAVALSGVLFAAAAVGIGRSMMTAEEAVPAGATSARIRVGDDPCCVALIGESVFAFNVRAQTLQRIDPATNTAEEPVPVPGTTMAQVGDKLLFTDLSSGRPSLYDPLTEEMTELEGPYTRGSHAVRGNTLWIGSRFTGELTPVDIATGEVGETVTVPEASSFDSMAFADRKSTRL